MTPPASAREASAEPNPLGNAEDNWLSASTRMLIEVAWRMLSGTAENRCVRLVDGRVKLMPLRSEII